MRYAQVDKSQPGIVAELRARGFSVLLTHRLGGDAPDIIVGKLGITVLVEVKTPGRERREKDRLAKQALAREAWQGESYIQASTVEQVVEEFQRLHRLRRPLA